VEKEILLVAVRKLVQKEMLRRLSMLISHQQNGVRIVIYM